MATATKRATARASRGMATATRAAGDKKGDGASGKEGNGNQWQQHGQLLRQRGWGAFDGGDNGDGAKETVARATTGERGMMAAMGHGSCVCFGVCGETTKNEEERKIVNET
jgi:hypothetical protein